MSEANSISTTVQTLRALINALIKVASACDDLTAWQEEGKPLPDRLRVWVHPETKVFVPMVKVVKALRPPTLEPDGDNFPAETRGAERNPLSRSNVDATMDALHETIFQVGRDTLLTDHDLPPGLTLKLQGSLDALFQSGLVEGLVQAFHDRTGRDLEELVGACFNAALTIQTFLGKKPEPTTEEPAVREASTVC